MQNNEDTFSFTSFLKLTPHYILITTEDGKWQMMSKALEEFLNISGKDWQNKTYAEIANKLCNSAFLRLFTPVGQLPPEGKRCKEEVETAIEEVSAFEVFHTPIPSTEGGGVLTIVRDITKYKENLKELAKEKEKTEEALKQKDRFISMIAHDFRSPISSILSLLKMMQIDTEHPLSEKQQGQVTELLAIGEQTYNMFQELLNMSSLKSGQLRPSPKFLDAQLVVDIVGRTLSPLAKRKGVKMMNKINPGTRVYADPNLFGEVVQNLLTNAIKFTRKDDVISIKIIHNEEAEETTLTVTDSGIGIENSFKKHLFSHDVKTTCRGTAGERGTGLGLPFCSDILHAHKGRISMKCTQENETCFCAHFPKVKPIVLLVEDERIARNMLRRHINRLDVEIIEAENGREALDKISEKRPHLILSDLMMPVMNGFDFVQEMKKDMALRSIPIIVTTADNDIKTRERLLWLGADDYTTKPIIIEDLIPRVRRYII